jgi:hypothetical protein
VNIPGRVRAPGVRGSGRHRSFFDALPAAGGRKSATSGTSPRADCRTQIGHADWRPALGTYHGLRRKHVDTYLNEFVFRYNRRFYRHVSFEALLGLATHPAKRSCATWDTPPWRTATDLRWPAWLPMPAARPSGARRSVIGRVVSLVLADRVVRPASWLLALSMRRGAARHLRDATSTHLDAIPWMHLLLT